MGQTHLVTEKAAAIEEKYNEERDKRLAMRPEGEAQYIDATLSVKYKRFQEDLWVKDRPIDNPDITECKYLITGAGFSGLMAAVRLLENGASPDEICLVDPAGGFGGVWYWNRYPGLMCDIESYVYMPLLEETHYMPKHKYSYGPELRGHAERIAHQWGLEKRALFRQQAKKMDWDSERSEWVIQTEFAGDERQYDRVVRAQFVFIYSGTLVHPKLPKIPGFDDFQGTCFHTSRWDYDYTGGNPTEAFPKLEKLKDKVVAIVGTGATAIQAVPELAKWAKHLYVVQRTPSSVDVRAQRKTDPEIWEREIANKPGWQLERCLNFNAFTHRREPLPEVDMVSDGWTAADAFAYAPAWGFNRPMTVNDPAKHKAWLLEKDLPRAERIRKRVDEVVKDKETAQHLKHWYPIWCKRPCFHDEYLEAFNRDNVTLIDTGGKGVQQITRNGFVAGDKAYRVDLLILSTGFKLPFTVARGSPAGRSGLTIHGREGLSMDAEFNREVKTLHGVMRRGFPNLFWGSGVQTGLSANQLHCYNVFANHAVHIIKEAEKRQPGKRITVEPTEKAQDDWGTEIAKLSAGTRGKDGCTPTYFNAEGDVDKRMRQLTPESQAAAARAGMWGRGIDHYAETIEKWRDEGSLSGLVIESSA